MYHLFCHKLPCLYWLSHRAWPGFFFIFEIVNKQHLENQTTNKNSQTASQKKKKVQYPSENDT